MERIKLALEKSQAARRGSAPGKIAESSTARSNAGKETHSFVYTQTRSFPLDPEYLRSRHVISSQTDPVADEYKVLRTHVLQQMREQGLRSIAVTSPMPGSGKSLTAVNLSISLAREMNQTVLLVDFDLHNPKIATLLSAEPMPGLSDYLLHEKDIPELLVHPGIERLVVLPGNVSVADSSEMLSSPKVVRLVRELRERYETRILVFDLPPVLTSDDVLAFRPHFDAALLVAARAETRKADLQRTIELLGESKVLGTLLNKSRTGTARKRAKRKH